MVNSHAKEFSSKLPYSNALKTKKNIIQVLLLLNGKELLSISLKLSVNYMDLHLTKE